MTARRNGVILAACKSHGLGTGVVEYLAPEGVVVVELDPRERPPGRIAGVEGLGSELFFDATGELTALHLSAPVRELRVRPAAALAAPPGAVQPGTLLARDLPRGPLGLRTATFSDPFGAGMFVFGAAAEDDPSAYEFVAVCPGVVAGVSRAAGALSFVWAEGFDRRQRVFGQPVSVENDSPTFMTAVNAIHIAFLIGAPTTFAQRARPLAAAAGDPRLARLVEAYERMSAVDAAVEAAGTEQG